MKIEGPFITMVFNVNADANSPEWFGKVGWMDLAGSIQPDGEKIRKALSGAKDADIAAVNDTGGA